MTKLDLRTLRLAPGDYRREQVTATIAPFTAGAQDYHAEPAEVQAKLGLTRLAGRAPVRPRLRRRDHRPVPALPRAGARRALGERRASTRPTCPEVVDEETTPYLEGELLDVDRWATDSAILALPIVIRCKADCAGLCPQCGADRNVVACGCEPPKDARWERLRELL